MHDIRETVSFDPTAVWQDADHQFVRVGERTIQFLPLAQMLFLEGGYRRKGNPLLLLLDAGDNSVGVCVDAVLHEEEVLVRALPRLLSAIVAFRGAGVVGDGRTILILDAAGLTRIPVPPRAREENGTERLVPLERDQLMEIMNMVASHAGGALSRRIGSRIELSVPECADGIEALPEEDWGASSIGVRVNLEGEYPGHLLFEIPATLSARLTEKLHSKTSDLHDLSNEERAFFQEIGQIAMHAVGNMLSQISKHPVMTTMSDIRVDARGALRTYFLSGHQGLPEELVRVRLWFGVGEGIRTDDHRETGSLTMELRRGDAKKLLQASMPSA
jgi:chemotaxis protein CheY-P-specific phosphatase CheC